MATTACGMLLVVIGLFTIGHAIHAPQTGGVQVFGGGSSDYVLPMGTQTGTPSTSSNDATLLALNNPSSFTSPQSRLGLGVSNASNNSSDLDALLSQLAHPPIAHGIASSSDTLLQDAYAFIPSSLIGTTTGTKRTAAQEALYDYGNAIGDDIQLFERKHSTMLQVLQDQLASPNDAVKASAVASIASDLSMLGQSISATDAPPEASAAAAALAQSYLELGAKLALVPQAHYDADRIAAITTYDTAANTFVTGYVGLASIFSSAGVTFAPGEPGSVFTFTSSNL